jgi:uncharacterized protein involved in exopolysaccharide biosynthesis
VAENERIPSEVATSSGNRTSTPSAQRDGEDSVSLLEIGVVLAEHKRLALALPLSAVILAAIVSLLLPNVYTATARILPPQQGQSAAATVLGQLGGIATTAGVPLSIKNPADLYVGMLRSRTVADRIIVRFGLQRLYDEDTIVDTRKALDKNVSIRAKRDGIIQIDFDDEDPKRAAAVANGYVEELDKLTQSLAVTEAAQRRLFFERQIQQARRDLANAEVALKQTQEKTGLIQLDNQARAIIDTVAALRAQIASKEVELTGLRTFATANNPEYIVAEQQLFALRAQLTKLERSRSTSDGDILVPVGKVPEAGLDYLRKLRDVKYYETIFELMAKQYELARVDEARDAAIIQFVDHAIPPDRKSKPKRALIVLATGLIVGILTIAGAVGLHRIRVRLSDPLQVERIFRLKSALRSWKG